MPLRVVSSSAGRAGAAQVVVPKVTELSEAAAKAALEDFIVRVQTVEVSGTAGTVFAQDPAAAAVRPRRSAVTIFIIVNPVPGSAEVATALAKLQSSVDELGTTMETEAAAKGRNDEVLKQLKEIKDSLPASGGGGSTPTGGPTPPTPATAAPNPGSASAKNP